MNLYIKWILLIAYYLIPYTLKYYKNYTLAAFIFCTAVTSSFTLLLWKRYKIRHYSRYQSDVDKNNISEVNVLGEHFEFSTGLKSSSSTDVDSNTLEYLVLLWKYKMAVNVLFTISCSVSCVELIMGRSQYEYIAASISSWILYVVKLDIAKRDTLYRVKAFKSMLATKYDTELSDRLDFVRKCGQNVYKRWNGDIVTKIGNNEIIIGVKNYEESSCKEKEYCGVNNESESIYDRKEV